MNKNTNMNNNSAVALITAHGWVGVSTPVVMTAKYLASKGYLVDIYMTENELCNNLGIATPDITSKNIKIYKNKTQNSHQIITTSSGLKIYTTDLEFAAKYSSPPKKYGWIIGFDPAGLIRAALLASAWNVPFIYHSLELCSQEDPYKEIERIFSQKALFTLIQDNARADILAQTNGLDRDKIEIIYNSSLGDASSEKSDFLRDTFKIQKDKKIVLATGTLLPITCIDQIIKSVDSWPGNFVLVLHGWIPDKNFELKVLKEIETKKDKIFLSTEILGVEEKHKVFQSADIGLAFYDPIDTNLKFAAGSSGKIFDFMKAGVPIIGNNIPGMSELLVGNGCGMVVNNASEIGNVLHNLMDQYEVLKKGCMENFPKYEFGRCYEKLLNRVISEIQRSQHMKKDSQAMLPLNNTASQNRLQSMDENILRNTDILVASYPRSGNTWVRNLLADIVLQVHGINTDTHRWEDTDRIVPDIHQKQLNNIDERLKLPYRLIKTHDIFNPLVQKTIYIFREASDSLCSYYHFLKDISNKKDLEDIDSFCINTLGEWYKHVHSYVNAYKLKGAKILFVSYELLHEDPITALLSITEFLDLEVNKKICERAVRNQEFQKHKNQSVTFYRKGIIGSSREELKETTLKYIKEKAQSLYEETKKLIHLSRFEQELEREFNNLRKTNSPKPDERFDSFVKRTINISTQAIKENQFEVALRLIVMAKYFKMPVYGLDYTRALSFLGMGQKESVVEALKEELRYFPQNSEAELLLKDIIKTSHTTEPTKYNSEFQELLDTVRPYTMVGEERLLALYQLAKKVCEMDIPGNFVECGVAGGGSSVLLAMVLKRYSKRKRILFSLDSFEGMPVPTEEDIHGGIAADSTGWGTGTCAAPEECVRELFRKLGVLDVVKTVKGYFKDTLPATRNEINHIAFLHMDGDWYESTRDILTNIYDLVDGYGFIQVDDYGYWEGCRKAIHEFEKNKGFHFTIQKIDGTGVWFQRPSEGISNVKQDKRLKLLNLGCGSHYKEGWVNVDFNSTGPGVIAYNLNCGIPFEDGSLDVVYHSHLLEHFSKNSAQRFMSECHRVLKDGGIIRVVVPDIEQIIKWYSTLLEKSLNGDQEAQKRYEWIMLELFDQMVRRVSGGEMLKYWKQNPMPAESFVIERCGSEVLNAINHLRSHSNLSQSEDHVTSESALTKEQVGQFVLSGQNHQWMYDRYSLSKLLKEAGFDEIRICSADESRIPDFNSYFMDIEPDGSVRKPDSLFVEAIKKENLVKAEGKKAIKIVHLCMQDFGGAGGAAYRLHRGLLSIGVNSTMVVLNKKSEDPSVKVIPDAYSGHMTSCIDTPRHDSLTWQKHAQRWEMLLAHYPKRPDGLEVFRDADSDVRLDLIKEVQGADIINLHWVNGVFDCKRAPSSMTGKPIVWTMHDMNPFTGGCHYAGDCNRYKTSCGKCPQLGSEKENDLSSIVWKKRNDTYRLLNINVVSPSKWLARCASESNLFSQFPVSVIPNSCPIDKFKPYSKKEAREFFDIATSTNVILFGADSVINKRKGFVYLLKALNHVAYNEKQDVFLATFGHIPDNIRINIKYPVKNLGTISETKQLAMVYSMADLLVVPSLEDNLPNTVIESMACGTPVVGFNIGGIPDMIDHMENGYVAKPMDAEDLAKGIKWILSSSEDAKTKLSKQCRKKAEEFYAREIQANNYRRLYEKLYEKHQAILEKTNELNRQAKQALQNGDIQKAKELLTKVLSQLPNNIKALNNLAVAKILEKDWNSAHDNLQKILQLDPLNQIALENVKYLENQISFHKSLLEAEKLIEQKEYSKALKILENILEIDDKHIDALNNLAVIGILEKDYNTARHLLERVLSIDNTNEIAKENITFINQISSSDGTPLREEINLSSTIDVSIVIATKDRAKLLDEMLTSLSKAARGINYEVIVIEGNSSDNTLEILHKHGIKQIYNETIYLGQGRHSWPQLYNFGFSKARGKWGMYASDDIAFNEGYLLKAVEYLNEQNTEIAGGIFFYKNVISEPGWGTFGIDYTYGQKLLMNYGLLRLEDFRNVNGLDEDYQFYCADGDLCLKLYEKGKKLLPLPQCLVIHNNVLDNQKKTNLNDSKHDIELYLKKWRHFVSTNKIPEPRRLFLEASLRESFDTKSTFVFTAPPQTTQAKKLKPNTNTLDQLRMAGIWIDGQPLRLHLGCGERRLSGYINIDYPPTEHTVQTKLASDVFADITALQFPDQTADEIRLHHVFEHFDRPTALALLCRWHLWLKAGGSILIETPDFEASTALIESPQYSYKQKQGMLRHIFGSHEAEWAVHKDGWYKGKFLHVLSEFGFCDIQFEFTEWQMTRNITVRAKKQRIINLPELQQIAKNLLRNCMIDGTVSEEKLWQVLCHKFEKLLIKTDCDKLPQVSIFIPVYNSEKYLAGTLDSILAQTFQDFEIIITDDGSTDKSLEIARVYENRDRRIKVLSLPHNGEVKARNEAIKHTNPNSKYLLNHDSDDISLPTKLKKLVEFLEIHPEIAIVGCFAEYFDGENNYKGQPPIEWQSERIRKTFGEVNSMINSASLIRREVFDKIGYYQEEYRSVDDYDFFARALIAGFELANIPEVLHRIRLHPASVGSTRAETQQILAEKIQDYYKKNQYNIDKHHHIPEKMLQGKKFKLHLGCGNIKIPNFLNIDIDPNVPAVDVVDDIKRLERFCENCASVIYACHVLEHFPHEETLPILKRWFDVLEPGGELRISVPDIDRIVKIYSKNWQHFQTPPNTPWIGLIFGGQTNEYDFHKTGFNFCYLKHLLEQTGFIDIDEYPHFPHWLGISDASLANEPFNEYLSLNVKCRKPKQNTLHITSHGESKNISILHTAEFYYPHTGGAETVVQQISERLVKRGHHVTVATTKLDNRTCHELNGVQIKGFSIKGSIGNGIFGTDVELYRDFLFNHRADIMMNYAAQQWATDLAFVVVPLTKEQRVNIIAPCGYSALSNSRTIRWPQFANYFNRVIPAIIPQYDAAIYHSAFYQDYEYAKNQGFANSIVIPNGVDEEEFLRSPRINFRQKYNIKTPFFGLCVANFYEGKGQERVIECVKQMNRPDFTMVFIGKEGDRLKHLKAQAANLNVLFCVNISREDILAAYHEADIFLFGSHIEASPLVIIEAKASKTPFVSTDCGNIREWKGGMVCKPEGMASHANKILDNEIFRKQLAAEGWREWKEKLTWESIVDKYEELYVRLFTQKRIASFNGSNKNNLRRCSNINPSYDNNGKPILADLSSELFGKAEGYFQQGAYDEAINNYKKTIEINPSFHDAYFNLAIAYTKTNQIENAIKILERVICLCPEDASVYNNLGVLCFKKNMYLDAKTYFEIALLLHDAYKEARENLDKVDKILKETSIAKKTNHTIGLIFSKDRAMQLDATLRSFYMHCGDAHLLDLKVIYKTSHAVHERHYEDLKKDYDNVEFIREENFKEQVLSLIRKYTFVLFLVDDNIFLRNFCISDLTKSLNENTNSIGFSLRLGENTVYCYALHSSQNSPAFTHIKSDFLKYDWTSAGLDFGYPLEVSSSLYRVKEIYPLLVQIDFSNPNTLEGQMAANKQVYIKTRPTLLCSKLSLTFCAPLNMVQDVCNNRVGSENCYSSEMLANKFGEGYRIAVEKYIGFTPNACHQEVPLDFKFKTMNPAVSIIIPCYNQAHYLPEAVASVVNQTFTDWECIIVNDGSSDNTSQVAILLISKYPNNKIRLINQENKGLAEARNNGIEASTGKYILPLDADDLILPEMLQKTVSLLEKYQEIAIAYTDVKHFGLVDKIDYAGEYNFKRLCTQNHLNYCSLYRREAWKATGGYNPNMTWGYEDWDFWIACGERGFYGKRIPEPLFMYRVKESSMYTKAREHHSELMSQIIINHPNLYDQKYIAEAKNILAQCYAEKIKTNPLVSVIVPTYNRPDDLKKALESIATQTYKHIEVIVVNDAGTSVSEIIDTFKNRLTIKYLVHNVNKDRSAARNTAIKHASGKYIAYLDDDDVFYPDHIEMLVNFLETNNNYKVAYTDGYRAFQEKENVKYVTKKKDIPYSLEFDHNQILLGNFIPTPCIMHYKSCIDTVGMFDETLGAHEDWDLWIRMSTKFQFAHIKKITCEYSWREDGSSTTFGRKEIMDYTRNVVLQRGIKIYREKQIRELFNRAEALFQSGAYNEAIDAYKKAIETSPSPNQQLPPEETSRLFDAYYNLALSYVNIQNLDDAIATFQKAVELHNADATIYNNLGVLYFKKKMHDDARRCFEKALAIDANYAEAQQNLEKISILKNS